MSNPIETVKNHLVQRAYWRQMTLDDAPCDLEVAMRRLVDIAEAAREYVECDPEASIEDKMRRRQVLIELLK